MGGGKLRNTGVNMCQVWMRGHVNVGVSGKTSTLGMTGVYM